MAVVGLGYVGLPLCETLIRANLKVTGIDRDLDRVNSISAGLSPISDLAAGRLREMINTGFTAQSDFASIEIADVVVLSLPTPLDSRGEPDLTSLLSGVDSIAPHLNREVLVVLESTVAPGTTDVTVLSRLQDQGKDLGKDFLLAYSPERVDPGASRDIQAIPKILAGVDAASLAKAKAFYEYCGFDVVLAKSTRDAEAAKLLENTYRAVNIALVNELAQASPYMGVDIGEAIRLAATKPFGFTPFYPGAGVGGHCIPIDPVYLRNSIEASGGKSELVSKTLERNQQTPSNVATRISDIAANVLDPRLGQRIVLLGMTYKPNVNDFRESPGPEIANSLQRLGFDVSYHDPFITEELKETTANAVPLRGDLTFGTDALVVLLQSHEQYRGLELEFLPASHRLCAGVSTGQWTSIWDPSMPPVRVHGTRQ